MKLDTYIPCSKRKSGIAFLGHWVKIKAVEKTCLLRNFC